MDIRPGLKNQTYYSVDWAIESEEFSNSRPLRRTHVICRWPLDAAVFLVFM